MASQTSDSETRRTVCILGLGYIGLPTAAILAREGHHVVGVDVRPDVVDTINAGRIHIHEPGLGELVEETVASGRLKAAPAPAPADVFFLCVPTPINADKSPDLSYVRAAARSIRPHVQRGSLIILESTSPPQTTEQIVISEAVPEGWIVGEDVFVAHCPERVLPGRILIEAVENDRIVGGVTSACTRQVVDFYETFVEGRILATSATAAEMAKLVENSFRDVNIAFANELSVLAERFGADPFEIIELANRHPRVNILTPGPGVGGHCISVDPWFLVHGAPQQTPLIAMARRVNDAKPQHVVEKVVREAAGLESPVIGCLGLAYKADVDDLRESPSVRIAEQLTERFGAERVLVCEPYVDQTAGGPLNLAPLETVLEQADILVLLTDHRPFYEIPAQTLAAKRLVDTRGIWRDKLAEQEAQILPAFEPQRRKAA